MNKKIYLLIVLIFFISFSACERKIPEGPLFKEDKSEGGSVSKGATKEALVAAQEAFIDVAQKVTPAVVNISTVQKVKRYHEKFGEKFGPFAPFFDEDPLKDFFGGKGREKRISGMGSGFIINSEGYILTNEHVVRDVTEITVKLSDRSEFKGKVIGTDPKTDIAIVKIEQKNKLPAVTLGDSDKIRVGQWAIAIGNPFGLDRTVTVGIISATGRSDIGIETYENFIQTDASINPGNSGGPLVDINGNVVGMNTAIVASGQGIGFAIPVNMVKTIAEQLIKTGSVKRGWLGVGIQNITPELAESFGIKAIKGVLVNRVYQDSPASKAGIQQGDVIIKYDGRDVENVRQLQNMVVSSGIGKVVEIIFVRNQKEYKAAVKIEELKGEKGFYQQDEDLIGLRINEIPASYKKKGIIEGVIVEGVKQGSVAESSGMQPGDIILSVNQKKIKNVNDYEQTVKKLKPGSSVTFLILRGDLTLYLAFKIGGR